MPKTNKQIEIQIEQALDSLSEQSKPNIAKTAREFAVPEGRLRRRWKGGKSLFQRQPNCRRLNPIQEEALCKYINYLDTVGASINRRQITIVANSILEEDHRDETEPPPKIGDHWLKRFLKRRPEYYIRRRRALDVERAAALDKSVASKKEAIQWISYKSRIYNCFRGCFYRYGFSSFISGRLIVYLVQKGWSHLTRQFIEFCNKNNIILFFLLSYTSHILQPLDIGVFSYSKAVKAVTITGCRKFSKDEFLSSIGEIRKKTFKPYTIKLGFKLTGLWPINPKLITDELESYDPYVNNLSRSSIPSILSHYTEFSTPKTAEKIRQISLRLHQYSPSTQRFKEGLAKLAKGAEEQAILAYQLQREFDSTQAIMGARHARYDASRRNIRITGIINAS
ncbi:hypothetical protein N7445_008042 [Penicillium cf. griseofulvum]|nr:hypothetical protein N7445_008042 [Penicillium cf. griseofulvum]